MVPDAVSAPGVRANYISGMATAVPPPLEKGFAMRPINVVLAHHDAAAADRLAASLGKQFRNLAIAKSAGGNCPGGGPPSRSLCGRGPGTGWLRQAEASVLGISRHCVRVHPSPGGRSHVVRCAGRRARWIAATPSDLQGILLASERYVVLSRSRTAAA